MSAIVNHCRKNSFVYLISIARLFSKLYTFANNFPAWAAQL